MIHFCMLSTQCAVILPFNVFRQFLLCIEELIRQEKQHIRCISNPLTQLIFFSVSLLFPRQCLKDALGVALKLFFDHLFRSVFDRIPPEGVVVVTRHFQTHLFRALFQQSLKPK